MTTIPATIHVVDDDPSFRVAIARLLGAAGYEVVLSCLGVLRDILLDIRRDNKRAAQIIRHMQNLLRSNEAEVQTIDLNDVACVVHEILKPHAAEVGVEMKMHYWRVC